MVKKYSIDNMIGESVYTIISYVSNALRNTDFDEKVVDEYRNKATDFYEEVVGECCRKATDADYFHVCAVSREYIDMVNDKLKEFK